MSIKYHAIDVANGVTLALVDVTRNPNDDSLLIGTITPLTQVFAAEGRERMLCNVMAMIFPLGTADIYIAKDLLLRIGVSKEDMRSNIRYIKVVT